MRAASSGTPSGAGLIFFSPSMALVTMPFFGPSLAGRSNSTTGTPTLTRWAAICAPITPAPRTATLRTWNRFMRAPSLHPLPGLVAVERADEPAHLERPAVVLRRQAHLVGLAVARVEDRSPVPVRLVGALADAFDDRHAEHRLALAGVGAGVALRVLARRVEQLLDPAAQHAAGVGDAHERLLLLRLVVDRPPQAGRRRL